jgi:hypothetical protein
VTGEPGALQTAGQPIRDRREELREVYLARVHAQPVRHICGVCGQTREGAFGETLAWYREHAKACPEGRGVTFHGQPLIPSLARLDRLDGRRIEEARLTRVDEHGDEVEVTLYLDDGSSVRFAAADVEPEGDPPEGAPPVVGPFLTVEVVG